MTRSDPKLRPLKDSDLTLPHSGDDIRWCHVVDRAGHDLGTIDDLLIDEVERKVRFLEVSFGGFLGIGASKLLIPIDAVEMISERVVHVNRWNSADHLAYDPELVDESYYATVYDYFGY